MLLLLMAVGTASAQKNLGKMSEQRRNRLLLKEAKEAMMYFAPGYYNETPPPTIEWDIVDMEKVEKWGASLQGEQDLDREFYIVQYYYNSSLGYGDKRPAILLRIWEDTGEVFDMEDGSWGYTLPSDWKEQAKQQTRSGVPHEPRFKFQPPRRGPIPHPGFPDDQKAD